MYVYSVICIFLLVLHAYLHIAGVDYLTDGFPREITIPAGQTSFSFPILVNNEGIVEQDEKFLVSFSYTAGQPGVTVTPGFDQATVTIWNDDG